MINIRPANIKDLDLFVQWAQAMAAETEGKHLAEHTVRKGMQAGLIDQHTCRYFVAEYDNQAAGTLMYTREWSDWRNAWWWWIQSVYVCPVHRRKGVYQALHQHVENLARAESNVCGLRLYVEHQNIIAQRTYASLGLIDSGYKMLEIEFSV